MVNVKFAQFDEQIAGQLLSAANTAGGLSTFLNFRHTEFTAGRLVAEMETREELLTPFGNLHGGCLSAMVDHCLGVVFYPVIPAGSWVATTEFKLNLLRPVSSGVCVAVTDIVSLGRRSGVARIDITNGDKAVCAAQGTVTIVSTAGNAS
jgi:1,4-dihydroxy-2-naphthoyl-CoA hydrolase